MGGGYYPNHGGSALTMEVEFYLHALTICVEVLPHTNTYRVLIKIRLVTHRKWILRHGYDKSDTTDTMFGARREGTYKRSIHFRQFV